MRAESVGNSTTPVYSTIEATKPTCSITNNNKHSVIGSFRRTGSVLFPLFVGHKMKEPEIACHALSIDADFIWIHEKLVVE